MACKDYPQQVFEFLDNQLPMVDRPRVQAHLMSCAECRALAQQLQQLDDALSRRLKIPTLSSNFTDRLRKRKMLQESLLSASERAERKRQLEAEFKTKRAKLIRNSFALGNLLNLASCAVLAGLAGLLISQLAPAFLNWLVLHGLGSQSLALVFSLLASAPFLLMGLTMAFPRTLGRLGLPA
jgi:anti-sigma factor RsiW